MEATAKSVGALTVYSGEDLSLAITQSIYVSFKTLGWSSTKRPLQSSPGRVTGLQIPGQKAAQLVSLLVLLFARNKVRIYFRYSFYSGNISLFMLLFIYINS